MKKELFFDSLRNSTSGLFGGALSQRQVVGIEALLDAGQGLPLPHMANVLAQVFRETGGGMYPVKETVYRSHKDQDPSDAAVIARLDAAFAKGQLSWVGTPYWRGGLFGRGQIQITHAENYAKLSEVVGVDLLADPSKALIPAISARIAVEGMWQGLFTTRKLSDYDHPDGFDHFGARDIVNGDKAKFDKGAILSVGQLIEHYAQTFEKALKSADWGAEAPFVHIQTIRPPNDLDGPPKGLWSLILTTLKGLFL
ncbi:hypothetical protein [Neptunicoccus cionae]|uniref:Glycoside hydrolase family 19 catalytic domain-containing protein n=1 Tax=Neptunicoccus cionae TaxID=2035344 RepID=A0A916R0G3_9RHOB|nr:hypothetical protein [Amylibacter cionae]GGA23866.1 hypothetical protein GCM10011498_25990 [Amylibacter cionae]